MTDGFDYETQLASLASRMITEGMGEPAVVANWLLVVDVRGEDSQSSIGVLQPGGMPDWIRDAMLREVGAVELDEFVEVESGEDEDE
jgi:hypothetical protein